MKNILFIIVLACMLLSAQLGFSALVNLETPAAPNTAGPKATVDGTVKAEGDKLASNATLLTTDLIDELNANATAEVNLSAVSVAASVEDVTDLKAYAIGLGSVRLAQVTVTGNRYDFSDTTINPLLFSDTYAVTQTGAFIEQVTKMSGDQIAVIIAIDRTPQEIEAIKAIKDKIDSGKVIIVQATTLSSKEGFRALFADPNLVRDGFINPRALPSADKRVVKALQGAV